MKLQIVPSLVIALFAFAPPLHALKFSEDLEHLLDQKISKIRAVMHSDAIVRAVERANHKHRYLTHLELLKRDRHWRQTKGLDTSLQALLDPSCAAELKNFQDSYAGLSEIFVTDALGVNVCQTNKTSDYYQADESWWQASFNRGRGKAFHGEFEYDESAQSEAISIYVPLIDSATAEVIGVAKAVIDINQIKAEL